MQVRKRTTAESFSTKKREKKPISKSFIEDGSNHYSSFLATIEDEFEGGSKRKKPREEAKMEDKGDQEEEYMYNDKKLTGDMVKNMLHATDITGTQHLQKMNAEMAKHGSKEKTGFMEKEAEFIKKLKDV